MSKKNASNFVLVKNDSRGPGTKPDTSLWSFGVADAVLEAGGLISESVSQLDEALIFICMYIWEH